MKKPKRNYVNKATRANSGVKPFKKPAVDNPFIEMVACRLCDREVKFMFGSMAVHGDPICLGSGTTNYIGAGNYPGRYKNDTGVY